MLQHRVFAILAACLLYWTPVGAAAQRSPGQAFLSLERYTPEEGLSQYAITALAEDEHGLLWIGTQEGLNRYDGHRFVVLRNTPAGEAPELASSSIDALAVDGHSRLWVGTNDAGLQIIDLRTRASVRLGTADGLDHPTVRSILIDPAGGAWLGTASGIGRVDADLAAVQPLGASAPVVAMAFSADLEGHALDQDCRLWRLSPTRMHPQPAAVPEGASCVAMQPAGDGFWLATATRGLYRVDGDGQRVAHRPAGWLRRSSAELSALMQRPDGRWLLGYADGAVLQAPADWSAAPTRIAFDQPIDSAITGFHQYRSGVLWIGSSTSGLFRVRALSSTIRRDLVDEAAIATWPSDSVRSILRDGTRLLVGTDAGLVIRDGADADWRPIGAIGATSVRAIAPARRGGWWVGSHRGLWHLGANGRARAVDGLPHPHVTALLVEAGAGGEQVWIATRGGLARMRNGVIDNGILDSDAVPSELRDQFLTSLMRDRNGRLWIGSNERGVYRIEPDGGVQHLGTHNGRLPHDSVWSLHADEQAVWLGTFGGLLRLDPASDTVEAITERDGLSNNVIYRIEPDALGRLWLSTNLGISVLDPRSGIIQTLGRGDGLFNLEYNSGASFLGPDGLLYLGGTDGLDILDPAQLSPSSPPATPMVTGLRVLGRQGPVADAGPAPTPGVLYAYRLELGHRDRVFQLDMVAVDFTAPDAARLRYRVAGIYDDWVHPRDAETTVVLSYLPPGDYPIEVQAAGRDGRFGPSRRLLLVMQPPPWRHPLAYAGYALLLLALLAWLVRRMRAKAREKHLQIERLNRTVAERTAALKQANHLLSRTNAQLESATRIDPLTRVSNRRDLHEWLERECPQLIGELAAPGAALRCMLFCVIDLDDFKRINDNHGHQVGDQVLVEVARRLRQVCRERDILVRWGGEEFLLLVRDAHMEDAARLAERVRRAIAEVPVTLASGQALAVTGSVGLAPWPLAPQWPLLGDWQQSVSLADRALYAAKSAGKNAWVGVVPGAEVDRACLQTLLAGAEPDSLPPGSIAVLHSTPVRPPFRRG
ncbi:MAG: diguanylate cyclase [Proteobacteria bacterium]|nr:diguanylate cyclase [Pseudomonadota bacterium]